MANPAGAKKSPQGVKTDVVLVGAGVISATLGVLLRQLQPEWSITMFEKLDAAGAESSDPWNNAGTGHSALCELNYTPQQPDGSVEISKAVGVNEKFQISRQFWSYAVEQGILPEPREFINPIPHISFVQGADDVEYLGKRYEAMARHPLFKGMEFSTSEDDFAKRVPLMSEGRDFSDPVAISWNDNGTDVNFGALTKQLLANLGQGGANLSFGTKVTDLEQLSDGTWKVTARNLRSRREFTVNANFVFVGAGGGALPLLQKSGIPEVKGYGGFPVSGEFLRCNNEDLTAQHAAKVYGKAAVGAPPMSVPHLDTRVIDGKRGLLYGPYAGWSPKFLKSGKFSDLPMSVKPNNLLSMMGVGLTEFGLLKYLISELTNNAEGRIETLSAFVPTARLDDWELITAGQRVQVIKRDGMGGSLEFGTAVLNSADGSIAGLLGASPGASTAVDAMLGVLERCFPKRFGDWRPKLKEMVPSLGVSLSDDEKLFDEVWSWTNSALQLDVPVPTPAQPTQTVEA